MDIKYIIISIAFLCLAHLMRISRWKMFIEIYEKPNNRNLIQALSYGYGLNFLLPFKMGDIFRAYFVGKKMKNKYPLAFSTVVMDRYLDILVVGFLFAIIFSIDKTDEILKQTSQFYALLGLILVFIPLLFLLLKKPLKKLCIAFAKIFNFKIESMILTFIWALIWNFKDIFLKLNKTKLIIKTIIMWFLYLTSYFFFAKFLNLFYKDATFIGVFKSLFVEDNLFKNILNFELLQHSKELVFSWLSFLIIPVVLLFCISLIFKKDYNATDNENYINLLPQINIKDRLSFLENYFSNKNRKYINTYLKVNQNISIIRDYSAGSNATTILCVDNENMFWRKYTFETDVEKLYNQVIWINKNKDIIPLPKILKSELNEIYSYYDMEYCENGIGFFEFIHSAPIDNSWNILSKVIKHLEANLYKINIKKADSLTIDKYIENKVIKNLETIKQSNLVKNLLNYKTVIINDKEYKNLPYYYKFLSKNYLKEIFMEDEYCEIHGDLTIENIICKRNYNNDDFYIIDPNPDNIHNSKYLDFAKILQSIHGNYEFLMKTFNVQVNENRINFIFTKSHAYNQMLELLNSYLVQNYGNKALKSIYFHEIIHWLRLLPYKLKKDKDRALMFYAGLLIVLDDIIKKYEN